MAVIAWMKRIVCGFTGHQKQLRKGADSLSMCCAFCSWESRGVVLDRPMPQMRLAGDSRKLRMTRKRVIRLRAVNESEVA